MEHHDETRTPGGANRYGPTGRIAGGVGAIVLVVFLVATSTIQVGESEFALVTRLGKPNRILDAAGLAFKLPWPIESVTRIDRRMQVFDPERGSATDNEHLTADKKNVVVGFFAVWQVTDPLKFLVTVRNREGAESRLDDILRSEIGTTMSRYELSAFLSPEEGDGSEAAYRTSRIMTEITDRAAESVNRTVRNRPSRGENQAPFFSGSEQGRGLPENASGKGAPDQGVPFQGRRRGGTDPG